MLFLFSSQNKKKKFSQKVEFCSISSSHRFRYLFLQKKDARERQKENEKWANKSSHVEN